MIPLEKLNNDAVASNAQLIRNLHAFIQHHKLNEAKLARITNIPQPTLHKILTGKTVDPRISTLKVLADYFNTSIDELYLGVGKSRVKLPKAKTQLIPVISWNDSLQGLSFLNGLTSTTWNEWLTIDFAASRCYALSTKPSMEPIFPLGTKLVVDPNREFKDGDLVIVYYPNSKEATIRKVLADGPTQLLAPINPRLKSDELVKGIKILGVVIESRYIYP